jgi:uncharacterized membrane protein YjjB (DUF3815 family)
MILELIYAFFATLGFAILFNLEKKKALISSIGGAIGWLAYSVSLDISRTESTSFFLGAVALSLFGEIMARRMKTPVTIFVIAALIPLVPGGGLYSTMLDSLNGNFGSAVTGLMNTLNNAGALAIGILFVFTGSRAYNYYLNVKGGAAV